MKGGKNDLPWNIIVGEICISIRPFDVKPLKSHDLNRKTQVTDRPLIFFNPIRVLREIREISYTPAGGAKQSF